MPDNDSEMNAWWLSLFILSRISYVSWMVVSGLTIFHLTKMIVQAFNPATGAVFAVWGLIVSWMGLGFVEYTWTQLLLKEENNK